MKMYPRKSLPINGRLFFTLIILVAGKEHMLQAMNVLLTIWIALFIYKTEYETPLRVIALAAGFTGLEIW